MNATNQHNMPVSCRRRIVSNQPCILLRTYARSAASNPKASATASSSHSLSSGSIGMSPYTFRVPIGEIFMSGHKETERIRIHI